VRDIIRQLRATGTTVFLNSHLLSEVEITCDRVAFIKHGEVVRISDVTALIEGETTVSIRARGVSEQILSDLAQWGRSVRTEGDLIQMAISDEEALPAISRHLVTHDVEVYSIVPQRLSLEDLFIQVVGTDGGL